MDYTSIPVWTKANFSYRQKCLFFYIQSSITIQWHKQKQSSSEDTIFS